MMTFTAWFRHSGSNPLTPKRSSPAAIGCRINFRISDHFLKTLGRDRLFIPGQVVAFQTLRDALRARHVEKTVAVHHHLHVRTHRFPHGGDTGDPQVDRRTNLGRGRARFGKAVEGRSFDSAEAILDRFLGRRGETFGCAKRGRAVDVGVDRQPVANLAAEQVVGRNLESLPGQVPQRLFDGAVGGGRDQSAGGRDGFPLLAVSFDVQRRLSLDQAEETAQLGLHAKGVLFRGVRVPERIGSLAQSCEAAVGGEPDDQPDGPVGRPHGDQLEAGDADIGRGAQRQEHRR